MTEDHKALIDQLEKGLLTGNWGQRFNYEEVKTLVAFTKLGAAAEGLVEALTHIRDICPINERGPIISPRGVQVHIRMPATEALAAYTAATQSTEPDASRLSAFTTSTPGEAASVARGPIQQAEANVIRWARALVMEPGGLRMTPYGTFIVEKADKSDPHYQLCSAFKRLDALQFTSTPVDPRWLSQGPEKPTEGDAPVAFVVACHAERDGDCTWAGCPQKRDQEPDKSGHSCPLWIDDEEDQSSEGEAS